MKKAVSVAVALVLFISLAAGCGQEVPLDMIGENLAASVTADTDNIVIRVMQYNVKNCDLGEKIDEVAEEIKKEAPQVVCLQELDWGADRSDGLEILKLLAQKVSMNYMFYPTIHFRGGLYGIGIMSVYPLENCVILPLAVEKGEEGRTLAKAQIRVNDTVIDIFNTHLSFESVESRQNQLSVLNAATSNSAHFILCGDFNINDFSELKVLENAQAVNNAQTDYQTYIPSADEADLFLGIDNILTANSMHIQNSYMVKTQVSDHNMLVADIAL